VDSNLFRPLKTASLKEEFVLYMEELILSGRLHPGKRLPPERELAREFGVSRPVVHEGILILEARGLVTLRPRHGVIINDYRQNGTLDLLLSLINRKDHELGPGLTGDLEHVRIHLERDMVRLICRREKRDERDFKELREITRKIGRASRPEELAELDFGFHLQLSLSSGNAVYALLINTLKPAHMDLLTRFYINEGNREKVQEYHEQLIRALRERDEETAVALIERTDSFRGYD